MEMDPLFEAGPDKVLDGLQEQLGLNHLTIVYLLAETAKHLCDENPNLSEGEVLSLLFGYRRFNLPTTISELVGNLPNVSMPKDTDELKVPRKEIVPSELKKARALTSGKPPLYTYMAFDKPDMTEAGIRSRLSAAKEAKYDGCILGMSVDLERMRPQAKGFREVVGGRQ